MRVSEILRQLADLADSLNQPEETADTESDVNATSTMVAPLQQELEMQKKEIGIDNNVDEFAVQDDPAMEPMEIPADDASEDETPSYTVYDENCEEPAFNEELDALKRQAGIGDKQQSPYNHAVDLQPVSINPRRNAAIAAHKYRTARPK